MFDNLKPAPPDAIMGLNDAFKRDPNPEKINLTAGVYKDATGNTPIFSAVKKAERLLLEAETSKTYLPIQGAAPYGAHVQALIFGADHEIIAKARAVTAETPGGTGALRVAADLLHRLQPQATVWLSEPTWPNHRGIFKAADIPTRTYPYYDAASHGLDFDAMTQALGDAQQGDVIVLHGCCHNPTGMDPTLEQWKTIAAIVEQRGLLPFFDFAYQGLGDGIEDDATGLRLFCREGMELLIATSYSKNFGLYSERTGALTVVTRSSDAARTSLSHLKKTIRTNYSNPPSHGAAIVTTILDDEALRAEWQKELHGMCARIHSMRQLFVDTLTAKGLALDVSFLTRQRGMFSYSGITGDQARKLREEHAVYILDSGRINVAGMTPDNMDALCTAVAAVLH